MPIKKVYYLLIVLVFFPSLLFAELKCSLTSYEKISFLYETLQITGKSNCKLEKREIYLFYHNEFISMSNIETDNEGRFNVTLRMSPKMIDDINSLECIGPPYLDSQNELICDMEQLVGLEIEIEE